MERVRHEIQFVCRCVVKIEENIALYENLKSLQTVFKVNRKLKI